MHHPSIEGDHHGNVCRANARAAGAQAPRVPQIDDTGERDLRQIAQAGYEGAASTDHDQQAQAVGLFLADTLFANLTA